MASNVSSKSGAPSSGKMADASPKLGAAARAAAALSGGPVPLGRAASHAARDAAHPYAKPDKVDKTDKKSELDQTTDLIRKEREKAGGVSSRETKASRYTRRLQEGLDPTGNCHIPGIMAVRGVKGELLLPYEHQRQACSMACVKDMQALLLAHDAGTGKTATFFQILAAMELCVGGGATAIITVPPATLAQWEQTAHDWLNLPDKRGGIVVTNKADRLTDQVLQRVRVLIISRHLLAKVYKSCWEWVKEHHQTARGHWVGAWVQKPGVSIHPLFTKKWTVLGVDEAHFMRNPDTEWCVSHNQLAKGVNLGNGAWAGGCKKRIALTATPVFNKPLDMVGLCKAIHTAMHFQDKQYWSLDKKCRTINPATVKQFQAYTDRVKDDILDLPEIHQEYHNFDANLSPEDAAQYNAMVQDTRTLKMRIEKQRGNVQDLQRLMSMLQKMQQMLISPLLAEKGAAHFKENPKCIVDAAAVNTGSLTALHTRIRTLQDQGHKRVIVAVCHVTLMQIAKKYLQDRDPNLAQIFVYDGTLTLNKRQDEREAFLKANKAVLFLSIGAGGTGLHLVPPEFKEVGDELVPTPKEGFCRAIVFWGSRPFSPAQVWQTLKRIHRIGQKYDCYVHHMIAYGSVDYAINCVHSDKSSLAAAIIDDDWSNCDEQGGNWKKTGRIVDSCTEMMETGNFPPEPPSAAQLMAMAAGQQGMVDEGGGVVKPEDAEAKVKVEGMQGAKRAKVEMPIGSVAAMQNAPPANLHPVFNPPVVNRESKPYILGAAKIDSDAAAMDAFALAEQAKELSGEGAVKMEM